MRGSFPFARLFVRRETPHPPRRYAARLVKEGITVNAVAPSLIETDMMSGQPGLVSRIPLGRFGTADEVAKAVMLLVDNAYMTGQTVALSGGMAFS